MLPGEHFGELDSLKRHILHSLDRTQLIYKGTLLSFSQSLVIHESRAESAWKNHDSRVFKTKIHDSYMFRKYDSWFMIPLPPPILFNVATIYPQFFFDIHWSSAPYSPVCRNNLPIHLTLKVLSYVSKQSGWSWRKCQTSTIRPSRYYSCDALTISIDY